jgi:hypothetical protein
MALLLSEKRFCQLLVGLFVMMLANLRVIIDFEHAKSRTFVKSSRAWRSGFPLKLLCSVLLRALTASQRVRKCWAEGTSSAPSKNSSTSLTTIIISSLKPIAWCVSCICPWCMVLSRRTSSRSTHVVVARCSFSVSIIARICCSVGNEL